MWHFNIKLQKKVQQIPLCTEYYEPPFVFVFFDMQELVNVTFCLKKLS